MMMPATVRLGVALVSVVAVFPARADDSLRCEGRLVTVGSSALELVEKCGEPSMREERLVEHATAVPLDGSSGGVREVRVTSVVERWTYNFGPDRFIEVVTLEGGRVRNVKSGGYGYAPGSVPDPSRCTGSVHVHDTSVDVLGKCGEPTMRDSRSVQRTTIVSDSTGTGQMEKQVTVTVETWTYDLGPGRLLLLVTLDGGRVISVERGGYGSAG